jgi:hypothetical protein
MNRGIRIGLLLGLLAPAWAHGQAKPPARAGAPKFESVTLGVRHRVFHDFRDLHTVPLNREFPLGDTEYSARVIRYVPDFQMDVETRRVVSLGDQPRNPAFQVVVRKNKAPHDTSWAFLKSPPHFGPRAYFAFQVLRIGFAGAPPLVADTTRAAPAMGMPPNRKPAASAAPHGMPPVGTSPAPVPAPASKDTARSR